MGIAKTRYEIEVFVGKGKDGKRMPGVCGSLAFGPAARTLRGRFESSLFATFETSENLRMLMSEVGDIPGEVIWCDLAKGEWGTYDPMEIADPKSPDGRKRETLRKIMKDRFTGVNDISFREAWTGKLKTADDAKNILYWMARAVASGHAVNVNGKPTMPSLDDVRAMPGRRRVNYGMSTSDKETVKILDSYSDYVPEAKS